jgi:hypothetical protein
VACHSGGGGDCRVQHGRIFCEGFTFPRHHPRAVAAGLLDVPPVLPLRSVVARRRDVHRQAQFCHSEPRDERSVGHALLSGVHRGAFVGVSVRFLGSLALCGAGVRPAERRNSRGAVFFVGILFLLGLLFGYYIAAPMSINFLSSYQVDESIINQIDIQSYVSTLTTMTLSCAFVFELPIVVFFLAKAGLVSAGLMREYRRHAIVVILVLAAIITPPDVSAQIIVTIPILLLYEASIWIAKAVGQR